jgi:hypothetical protein
MSKLKRRCRPQSAASSLDCILGASPIWEGRARDGGGDRPMLEPERLSELIDFMSIEAMTAVASDRGPVN